jgi:hypothetical protein
MIEFEKKYSTPLAQKQYEFELVVKSLEIARAENFSRVLYSIAVGFGYVLLMGGFIGYSTFDGGYIVSGWLSILTVGFILAGKIVTINAELSRPNIRKAEKFLGVK